VPYTRVRYELRLRGGVELAELLAPVLPQSIASGGG
jgi:hypothetical protein